MHGLIEAIKDLILNVLGVPVVIYRVAYTPNGMKVLVDEIGVDHLWCVTTQEPNQNAQPQQGALDPLPVHGIHLRITRPDKTKPGALVAIHCGVSTIPSTLRRFTLTADYVLLTLQPQPEIEGSDFRWAATLVARDGDNSILTANNTIVGATHQVRRIGNGKVGVLLGAAGDASNTVPPGLEVEPNDPHDQIKVYPNGTPGTFTLETDIDCVDGRGWSRLRISASQWPERAWSHPWIASPDPTLPSPISAVGVGVAIPVGVGTVAAVVRDFAIYKWRGQMRWWRSVVAPLIRYR